VPGNPSVAHQSELSGTENLFIIPCCSRGSAACTPQHARLGDATIGLPSTKRSQLQIRVLKTKPRHNILTRFLLLLFFSSIAAAQVLPLGTVVPVMLDSPLNASKSQSDKKIEGRVMQDVLVVGMDRIRERSRITGHIVSATKLGNSGSNLAVKFDVIQDRGRRISITAALLAFASDNAVSDAQSPINLTSDRDPMTQWTTRQVGGDVVARSRGTVGSKEGISGTWLGGTSVSIKLTPNRKAGCPDGPGYEGEQAVWVFSSSACGVYGVKDVKIESTGAAAPFGNIVLSSPRNISVRGGSGWLLMAVAGK